MAGENHPAELRNRASSKPDYGWTDLVEGLKLAGIAAGDVVFFQVSHVSLGHADCGPSGRDLCQFLYTAMREAIGPQGTMLLPAFSLSFSRNEDFNLRETPAIGGAWSTSHEFLEYFRCLPEVVRSADPIYSVAGLGPRAEELLTALPNSSYGTDCLYDRLLKNGGKICVIGAGLSDSPFVQYARGVCGGTVPVQEAIHRQHRAKRKSQKTRLDCECAHPVCEWSI